MTYTVLIEGGPDSYGAYVPDLPGCVAVGGTEAEVRRLIREAMGLHLAAMREDGDPIPPPTVRAFEVGEAEAAAAAAALPDGPGAVGSTSGSRAKSAAAA